MDDTDLAALTEADPPLTTGHFAGYAFAVAALLTITMLGWQAWHLFASPQDVEHEESETCPTRAVAEVHFAAAHHDDLIDDLEHALGRTQPSGFAAWSTEWQGDLRRSARELDRAVDRAVPLVTPDLAERVRQVETASAEIDASATAVLVAATGRDRQAAVRLLDSPGYLEARRANRDAIESLVTDSQRFFQAQLRSERGDELTSVAVSVTIFAATIGAWVVFLRRIRRGQRRLAEESRQRRQAEEELLQAQKMDALGTMAAGVAHDFNNIVTAIWGSVGQARSQIEADSPAQDPLARIEAACEQANRRVRSLLTLGRRSSFERQPVDVGALIDETATLMEAVMPPSIAITTARGPGHGPWVLGDEVLIEQAVMNLILNARDAMQDGGRIDLVVRDGSRDGSADAMCLEVRDTGEGMAPEVLSRAFDPFYTTRDPGRGTGLGLAIVRSIIDGHGGEVRCDSVPGSGTVFTISLPTTDAPQGTAATEPSETGQGRTVGRGKVLLAEDHRQVREVLTGALEAAGYEAIPTASGAEFLETHDGLADEPVAMVIDLEIPEPDGLACLRTLRTAGVRTPIVLITGTPAPGLEDEVGDLAVVLRKPFEMRRLIGLLARSSLAPAGHRG